MAGEEQSLVTGVVTGTTNIDYEQEYLGLPVLPSELPHTPEAVHGDMNNFSMWLVRQVMMIAAKNPGWLAELDWTKSRQNFEQTQIALNLIRAKYILFDDSRRIRDTEIDEIRSAGGPYILPAVLLRGLEVLAPDYPELQYFWRGGSYQEGQSSHRISGKEFSLSNSKATRILKLSPRNRPTVFQWPVQYVVDGFKNGDINVVEETSLNFGLFGYSAMISTLNNIPPTGLQIYRTN